MKRFGKILAVLVAAALLLVQVGALAEAKITVQGIGTVNVDADRVCISLGVRESAKDVMTAQSAVNEKIGAVIEALKAMDVDPDAISTSGIGIYPNYSYDNYDDGGESITGYTAYNNIQLNLTDVEHTGAYIDAAFAAGANNLDYVDFSATATEEASAQALALAVESATKKAQALAEAAGMKLGAVVEIRDDGYNGYDTGALYVKNAESGGTGAGTDVLASKQTVSANISMTFVLIE